LPSQVKDDFWVWAERSGKYLLFVGAHRIDQVWLQIKKATEDGLLGDSSKCATMRRNPNAADARVKAKPTRQPRRGVMRFVETERLAHGLSKCGDKITQ
jgi:hypothetical protein